MEKAAELVLTFGAEGILKKVSSLAAQEIALAWGFKDDLKKLERSLNVLQDFLLNASEKPKHQSKAIEDWVQRLKDVAEDADNALDEFNYELLRRKVMLQDHMRRKVLNFVSTSNPALFRVKMAHKIKKINDSLEKLKKDAVSDPLIMLVAKKRDFVDGLERAVRKQTNSKLGDEVIGREGIVQDIVKTLVNSDIGKNNLSVLAIVGMGGLGKTTLAQSVYNTDLISTRFDRKIWMCVSNFFEVDTILNQMVESLAPTKAGLKSQDALIKVLTEELKEKRYILVLDDVWNENKDKWDSLMNCLSNMGSKTGSCIVITTRSAGVASIAETLPRPKVINLTDDECWSILKQKAWKEDYRHDADRELIGRAIAVRCRGIPLVAKVLGGLMNSKARKEEWLSLQNSEIWGQEEGNKIMSILKLSFDNLKLPTLKQCFAYCSMLKKDFQIEKDELIQLWMAQGLLQQAPTDQIHHEMEDTGNQYFNILLHSSLLQEVPNTREADDTRYTMHDLVHDLAEQVSMGVILTRDSKDKDTSGVRHVAHVSASTLEKISENGGRLHSLFSQEPEIAKINFCKFKSLRVLGLSKADVQELPSSIGRLKHLRYLDVSRTRIKALPKSIGKLYNLQTLRMQDNIYLRELPTEIQNLTNLRHLDVSRTGIQALPESIGKLCNLQTLRMQGNRDLRELPKEMQNLKNLRHLYVDEHTKFPAGVLRELTNLRTFPCFRVNDSIGELGGLNKLGGTLAIHNLENVKDEEEAKKAELQEKKKIIRLSLHFDHTRESTSTMNDEKILEGLQPHSDLQSLLIDGFMGDSFPSWMMKVPLPLMNLKQLTFYSCWQCGELPVVGHLPFLGDLRIEGMKKLKCMGSEMYGYDRVYQETRREKKELVVLFPALKRLIIKECDELSEWKEAPTTTTSTQVVTVFPCLEELRIETCPKIEFIPITHDMTSLRLLEIYICNGLSSIGQLDHCTSLRKLKIYRCFRLSSIGQLDHCTSLQVLDIISCPSLVSIPISQGLPCLRELNIEECFRLSSIGQLDHCTSLQVLDISSCESLVSIPISQGLPCLRELKIYKCNGLSTLSMSGMENCTSLRELDIYSCSNLSSLDVLEYCPILQKLRVRDCHKLEELNPPHSLEVLYIQNCDGLLLSLPDLRSFSCDKLMSLPTGLGNLTHLKDLQLGPFCQELDSFPEFQVPPQLAKLRLRGWKKLKSLPQHLQQFTLLTELFISSFNGVETLPDWLGNLASLEVLDIFNCEKLKYLPSLEAMRRLTKLQTLKIEKCPLLEKRCEQDSGEEWHKISHIPEIQGRFW